MSVSAPVRALLSQAIDLAHPRPFVSVKQIADYTIRSPEWVWRKIRSGELPASRWGGHRGEIRVKWEDFLELLQAGESFAATTTEER